MTTTAIEKFRKHLSDSFEDIEEKKDVMLANNQLQQLVQSLNAIIFATSPAEQQLVQQAIKNNAAAPAAIASTEDDEVVKIKEQAIYTLGTVLTKLG